MFSWVSSLFAPLCKSSWNTVHLWQLPAVNAYLSRSVVWGASLWRWSATLCLSVIQNHRQRENAIYVAQQEKISSDILNRGFIECFVHFLWNLILCCLMVTTAKATLHIHPLNHFFLCWEGASQLAFWSLMSINFLQQIHKLLDCLQLSLCPPRTFQEVEIPITTGEDMSLEFLSTN